MYDKELALDSLANIEDALKMITERASAASTPDDFLISPDGMLRLGCYLHELDSIDEIKTSR